MRNLIVVLACLMGLFLAADSHAYVVNFSAQDVINTMSTAGAPLDNSTNQWGLWAVRAMPIVTGGSYTITGGSTIQTGWGVSAPGAFGAAPYSASNSAWFWDASGAEAAGTPANPLYMIMSNPANTFTSYTFNSSGVAIGSVPPDSIVLPQVGGGGTNVVTAVNNGSTFSFNFTLGTGATWDGRYQFVVDGSKYTLGSSGTPGVWVEDFFGGYQLTGGTPGGGLTGNMEAGYQVVPIPAAGWLLGSGLIGLVAVRRRVKK